MFWLSCRLTESFTLWSKTSLPGGQDLSADVLLICPETSGHQCFSNREKDVNWRRLQLSQKWEYLWRETGGWVRTHSIYLRSWRKQIHAGWKTWSSQNMPAKPSEPGLLFVGRFLIIASISLLLLLLLLLSRFSCARLCATPSSEAHQAPPSLGFSRREHWSGLTFPSPMHKSEKWKWRCSVVSDS